MNLSFIDHIAVESTNIKKSVDWYCKKFDCEVKHQDETWALLGFDNISLALVTPGEHPPHIAIHDEGIKGSKNIKVHRDGIGFIYQTDPDTNFIELIDQRT
jgi:catechol 2,3-dioxygenase-like lactoylglutathione lyase family enzyme